MSHHKRYIIFGTLGLIFFGLLIPIVSSVNPQQEGFSEALPGTPTSAATTYDDISVTQIYREFYVELNGILDIHDSMTFENNNPYSISTLHYYLAENFSSELVFSSVTDANEAPISFVFLPNKISNYVVMEIILDRPLLPYSSIKFAVNLVYKDRVSLYAPTQFLINCELNPILPYPIDEFSSTIILPDDFEPSFQEDWYTDVPSNYLQTTGFLFQSQDENDNIDPLEQKLVGLVYSTLENPGVRISDLHRIIDLHPTGYIRVWESMMVENLYDISVTALSFLVPEAAFNVEFSDDLGIIQGVSRGESYLISTMSSVTLSLDFNRAQILPDNVMYLEITYEVPIESYMSKKYTTRNLNIDMYLLKTTYLIENLEVEVNLIGARKITRSNVPSDTIVKTAEGLTISKTENDVSYFEDVNLDVEFKISWFKLNSRALLYMFIIFTVLGAYVVLRTKFKGASDDSYEEESLPIQELSQFVTLYEEKNALLLDIEAADEALLRRRLQKKAHNKTIKTYTNKIKELEEEIGPFKTYLVESGPKLASIIQKLDYLEAEKLSVKDSITLLQDRYKKGKLPSKAAYEQLSNDLIKRMGATQKKIDRNINELRAYLI